MYTSTANHYWIRCYLSGTVIKTAGKRARNNSAPTPPHSGLSWLPRSAPVAKDDPYMDPLIKGAVSRNSAKLGNYKMPVKLRET